MKDGNQLTKKGLQLKLMFKVLFHIPDHTPLPRWMTCAHSGGALNR